MTGVLVPGDPLDPEALEREFGVSRTVVRESLKVLTAKGLVDARPRRGTFVTQREAWQLLDADVIAWRSGDSPDPLLVIELGEVREVIEPAAARMAAARRTEDQRAALEAALERLEATGEDVAAHAAADVQFHRAVLLAAGNELLQRFEVLLEPALHARDTLAFRHERDVSYLQRHRAVYEAIAERDADRAFAEMDQMMRQATADSRRVLAAVADGGGPEA